MKTHLFGSLIVLSAATAMAQGTVNFGNWNGSGLNAPVYLSDGYTKASGPQYRVGLMAGPTTNEMALVATTGFSTGAGVGYFSAGSVTIPTVAGGGTAVVQVIVWNTANGITYFDTLASGELVNNCGASDPFLVKTGDPTAQPPTFPGALSGLTSFNFAPPELLPGRPLPLFWHRTLTNTIVLSWPFMPSPAFIQQRSEFAGSGWTTLGTHSPVVFTDTRFRTVLPAPTATTFYKLVSYYNP